MHSALSQIEHRPWRVPEERWRWRQSWCDLLFAHWPISVESMRAGIPRGLEVDTYDGEAWISVVPFRMSGVTRRMIPPIPGISEFPELNVRTYVTAGGKPGVWFFSLDAASRFAVWAARRYFHLPYHHSRMKMECRQGRFDYSSLRSRGGGGEFVGSYSSGADLPRAQRGSLDHWLTERYCLYCEGPRGELMRVEVHHRPWELQGVEVDIRDNTLLRRFGITDGTSPRLAHFSKRTDVVTWSLQRI